MECAQGDGFADPVAEGAGACLADDLAVDIDWFVPQGHGSLIFKTQADGLAGGAVPFAFLHRLETGEAASLSGGEVQADLDW